METEAITQQSRGHKFAAFVIERMKTDSGFGARLRRADNQATEYQSWEILSQWCDLENPRELISFTTIGAAIAKSKPQCNGKVALGRAIASAYKDGNRDDAAKAKLRRLLACNTLQEVRLILRSLLTLIAARGINIDYGELLNQLLYFGEKTRLRWAVDFYGRSEEK